MGYGTALFRDVGSQPVVADLVSTGPYPGYAIAVNLLIAEVFERDQECLFAIIGGDDVQPEPNVKPDEIVLQLVDHFGGTFGVCQPVADRWGENPNHPRPDMRGAYIDRVCGSAWIGREFAKRAYGGKGPLWHEYRHMFVDEELQHVATRLGVLWQRRDLTQLHMHAGRVKNYTTDMIPPHLRKWTIGEEGRAHWKESERLFFSRRDTGFPGHEPI